MIDNTQAAEVANMIGDGIMWLFGALAFWTIIAIGFATVPVLVVKRWIDLLRGR